MNIKEVIVKVPAFGTYDAQKTLIDAARNQLQAQAPAWAQYSTETFTDPRNYETCYRLTAKWQDVKDQAITEYYNDRLGIPPAPYVPKTAPAVSGKSKLLLLENT